MNQRNQRKILYIEDDLEARELMADILHYHGFVFFSASRGLEGIKMASNVIPDLILMDIDLPDMQGYEVTTYIKSDKKLKKIPIIALTGDTGIGAKERSLSAGCDGYISKPINITDFLKQIEEYLEGRKDLVSPELEKKYLAEYNTRLVSKLQDKIEELSKMNTSLSDMNDELSQSKEQLTEYNNRLFYMNKLANLLRLQKSPLELLRMLPLKLLEGFSIDRCIIFEYDEKTEKIKSLFSAGVSPENLKKLNIKLARQFYIRFRQEHKILWIKNKSEIIDKSLLHLAQSFNSLSFILASISGWRTGNDETGIFKTLNHYTAKHSTQEKIESIPKKLIMFVDRGRSQKLFHTYEIRIFKAFVQSTSIIYENMNLYHQLYGLYQIREQEAETDPLTELYNYRYFRSESERELLRSDRYNKPFSLALIDIDNFKSYNDTLGHLAGDKALKSFATILLENTRKSDTIARYGGDEFILILPELAKKQAKSLAVKLCNKLKKNKLLKQIGSANVNLTVSIGIASFPVNGKTVDELLKKADSAMYQAKKSGKNTVAISE